MLRLKMQITKDLENRLNSNNSNIFSKAQEELVMNVLYQVYNGEEPIKIVQLKNKNLNVYGGDLIIIYMNYDDQVLTVEVKSSHVYDNQDRQILELYHYQDEDMTEEYIQKSTNSAEGWFSVNDSDFLASYNRHNKRLYLIYDWKDVKYRLNKILDKYKDKPRRFERVNEYLEVLRIKDCYYNKIFNEFIINKYDFCASLNLEQLDKVSKDFEVFELEFEIIDEDSDNR